MKIDASRSESGASSRSFVLAFGALTLAVLVAWLFVRRSPPSSSHSVNTDVRGTDPAASATKHEKPADSRSERSSIAPATVAPAPALAEKLSEHASEPKPAGPDVYQSLDRVALSCLTNDPDVAGLRNIAEKCARDAVIDGANVHTDADGTTRGKFTIPGSTLQGTFTIQGDDYRVELPMKPPHEAGDAFFRASLSVVTYGQGADAKTAVVMQFDPDTTRSKEAMPSEDGETIVGWNVNQDSNGSVLLPITMRRLPGQPGLIVGHAQSMKPVAVPGDWDRRANDAWVDKLHRFAAK